MSNPTEKAKTGFLTDHEGKPSMARVTSFFATVSLCVIGLATVFISHEVQQPSENLLWVLASVALGPLGFNRAFGEKVKLK